MMMGDQVGRWRLSHVLGSGLTADVWVAREAGMHFAVVKILRDPQHDEHRRTFVRGVELLRELDGHPGLIPVIDADLTGTEVAPWYSMPGAYMLEAALGHDPSSEAVVAAYTEIAATMVGLHAIGITHDDLMPLNLFRLDDRWVIGDAGGLERHPPDRARAAGFDATDVAVLATSLWLVLAPRDQRWRNVYIRAATPAPLALTHEHPFVPALDDLIARATAPDPLTRPTMAEFHRALVALPT